MIWLELYKSLREIREEKKLKKYKIAVIPGDGIGVEVVSSALEVLSHISKKNDFELKFSNFDWSSEYYFKNGVPYAGEIPRSGDKKLQRIINLFYLHRFDKSFLIENKLI